MYFLCTVTAENIGKLFGFPDPSVKTPPANKPEDFGLVMIGQAPDCSSYLALAKVEHEYFVKKNSIPEGYDFIFRQAWGLTINEDIIHRTISTLRAEAYPPMADYLDAKVKGDTVAEQAYLDACAAVKVKYPKFSF